MFPQIQAISETELSPLPVGLDVPILWVVAAKQAADRLTDVLRNTTGQLIISSQWSRPHFKFVDYLLCGIFAIGHSGENGAAAGISENIMITSTQSDNPRRTTAVNLKIK